MTFYCTVDLLLPDFCNHFYLHVCQSSVQTVISLLPLDITCANNEDAHSLKDVLMTSNIWPSQENRHCFSLV